MNNYECWTSCYSWNNHFAICLMIAYSVLQYNANIELIKRYEWYEAVLSALPPANNAEKDLTRKLTDLMEDKTDEEEKG